MTDVTTQDPKPDNKPPEPDSGATVKLYNANDGLTGRDGGPYLDQEMAKADEIRRAELEGREPDFETMPLGPGVRLVTAQQLIASGNVVGSAADNPNAAAAADTAVESLGTVTPAIEVPVEEVKEADLSTVSWLAGENYGSASNEETPAEEAPAEEYDPLADEPTS